MLQFIGMLFLFVIVVPAIFVLGNWPRPRKDSARQEAWKHFQDQKRMMPTLYKDVKGPSPY